MCHIKKEEAVFLDVKKEGPVFLDKEVFRTGNHPPSPLFSKIFRSSCAEVVDTYLLNTARKRIKIFVSDVSNSVFQRALERLWKGKNEKFCVFLMSQNADKFYLTEGGRGRKMERNEDGWKKP
ncbi:MAG: hypothetical protein Q4E67_04520 [Planctomycetia bacterium]|nr:hypothetical protein [Planctomycetia bacterium]